MQKTREQFYLHRIRTFKDERAFARIYEIYAKSVYRILCARLPSPQDAEDVLSVTFVRLWDYLCRASSVDHLPALVNTIARAAVADFYRQAGHKTTNATESGGEQLPLLSDSGREAKQTEAKIDLTIVKQFLNTLPDEMRTALILRYFEGKSVAQVAHVLEKSESTTRVLLHRAIKRLRLQIAKKE